MIGASGSVVINSAAQSGVRIGLSAPSHQPIALPNAHLRSLEVFLLFMMLIGGLCIVAPVVEMVIQAASSATAPRDDHADS